MNTLAITRIGAVALFLISQITRATTITFTNDAYIGFADLSNEGRDIVVTNCTVTVDGPHTFNSIQVLNNGVVTHSPFTNGPQQLSFFVARESHVMSATNPATLNNPNVDTNTISVFNSALTTLYTEDVDYVVTFSNQFAQLTLTTNSAIAEGSTVLVNYDWTESFQGFFLAVSRDFTIAPGGSINVAGKGYAAGNGVGSGLTGGAGASQSTNFPFAFTAGGGGGHGGAGGMSSTFARGGAPYDSTPKPAALGSGGGSGSAPGGAGGGVATVLVSRNFQVDGQILAGGFRGTNAHSGGGAGGSILISAETISGTGTISANGGSGDTPDGGGGGGGRLALFFATNNFSGTISAFGGGGSMVGGAGTIYFQSDADAVGDLLIANGGKRGTNTTYSTAIRNLTISGGAILQATPLTLSVTNLLLGSNSWIMSPDSVPLMATVNGNATVESSAVISADSRSLSVAGSGSSLCGAGSGGGYGGYGGASVCGTLGGAVYGSLTQPLALGGAGASGVRGGGAIQMTVAGALLLAGQISANGASAVAPNSGSGAGGSVWLTVGTLSGQGMITANGGSSSNLVSGGGGGGRVAVYFDTNLFAGSITAHGGAGTNSGGPGSIYLKSSTDLPQIIFDNGGVSGNTSVQSPLPISDLRITGGSIVTNAALAPTLRSLFIGSNSWFVPLSYPSGSTATATNVTIERGGAIFADGTSISTSGAGQSSSLGGGGGGGSGYGGAGRSNALGGIPVNSSFKLPSIGGGAGGSATGTLPNTNGLGGGVISLTVPGVLTLDGRISANGSAGSNFNAGGGGGGSIRVSAKTISGAGIISANGGSGNNAGGGGAGGAIALYADTNLFSGRMTAAGGGGANFGGAGTIYLTRLTQNSSRNRLLFDNGGNLGARTPLGITTDILLDLTITNGAFVSNGLASIGELGSLAIGSNSVLQLFSTTPSTLTFQSNVTIFAGGLWNADGVNALSTTNQGQSLNSTGGGGGGGGTGGPSALGAAGGTVTPDSFISPTGLGGHGGVGLNQGAGGNGGGAIRLVCGTFRVDGKLSADGATSTNLNAGGGAGGSLLISVTELSGSGLISANGGSGNFGGGGGGGGHIAISFRTNSFTGITTARGGGGANFGGAGIIYLYVNPGFFGPPAQLIVDNGGAKGGYTPIIQTAASLPTFTILTITGGAIFTNNNSLPTIQSFFIGSNSTWLGSSQFNLTVASNATIQAGGVLTADGLSSGGRNPGQGGPGMGGGGGGNGGYGGASISNALGGGVSSYSIISPASIGSVGGFNGGLGGGAMQLTVVGTLQLDGKISADGTTSPSSFNSGGGSGGTIFLKAARLFGTGSISANGGAANNAGGGGGGGGIAVWYNSNAFTGTITARGGAGANYGGAGTVFFNPSSTALSTAARLIVDNGGTRGAATGGSLVNFGALDVVVTNGGVLGVNVPQIPILNNLTIASNSALTMVSNFTTLRLQINSNLDLQAGGALNLDGEGFAANLGTGRGFGASGFAGGGGGGHGGYGSSGNNPQARGGTNYDSVTAPALPGSGGGASVNTSGSAGGGVAQLTVNGICNINGVVSARGTAANVSGAGGGAGGSVLLTVGTLTGSGNILADGGNGDVFTSGGGGGGRVAILFKTNLFTGVVSAHGGTGAALAGGAGTIYWQTNLPNSPSFGQVIVDNGGLAGTNTPIFTLTPTPATLNIRNHGAVDSTQPLTLQNLSIDSTSSLFVHPLVFAQDPLNTFAVKVLGNAVLDTNATMTADADGFSPGSSAPGAGAADNFGDGSGGGYGGAGGASFFGAPGGGTYGSSNQPFYLGSPGGIYPILSAYSKGGGAIRFIVDGSLTLNGRISANGADGLVDGSGGGAGGSLWVTAQRLLGYGTFTANGGQGESFEGGGGGGGRIAIITGSNSFAGTVSAMGGDGAFPGQNGTIFVPTNFLISGIITNSSGAGVPGITFQPSGLASVLSDSNGNYSVTVPPLWTGSIIPSANGIVVPSQRSFANLSLDQQNQNFLIATSSIFNPGSGQFDGTNFSFNWFGLSGVQYQVYSSSNLVDWVPYGSPITGGNAPVTITVPANAPNMYFRLNVVY